MKDILINEWRTNGWLKFLSISALVLIVVGIIIPPIGEISGSLLTAIGELEFFGVLLIINNAIEIGTNVKASKGDTSIEVNSKDKEK